MSKRRLRRAAAAWTALAAGLALLACGSDPGEAPSAEPSALVETAVVARGPIEETLVTFGTVEFDPDRTHVLAFLRAGQVLRVAAVAGQQVAKGDLLVQAGATPSASPDARQARIELDFAEREVARVERLRGEGLATNAEYEAAQKGLATARAGLAGLGADGVRATSELRAPEDSVVVDVAVTPGALVQAGQVALTLAARDALLVRAGFEPADSAELREGVPVRIEPLFGEPDAPVAHSRIAQLHTVVGPTTQLLDALLHVDPPPLPWMVAGAKVRVIAVTQSAQDALCVPREALLERSGATGVFAVVDGHAQWRAVSVGLRGGEAVELRSGVAAGERVVTVGRTSVDDGMRVRVASDTPAS